MAHEKYENQQHFLTTKSENEKLFALLYFLKKEKSEFFRDYINESYEMLIIKNAQTFKSTDQVYGDLINKLNDLNKHHEKNTDLIKQYQERNAFLIKEMLRLITGLAALASWFLESIYKILRKNVTKTSDEEIKTDIGAIKTYAKKEADDYLAQIK